MKKKSDRPEPTFQPYYDALKRQALKKQQKEQPPE